MQGWRAHIRETQLLENTKYYFLTYYSKTILLIPSMSGFPRPLNLFLGILKNKESIDLSFMSLSTRTSVLQVPTWNVVSCKGDVLCQIHNELGRFLKYPHVDSILSASIFDEQGKIK